MAKFGFVFEVFTNMLHRNGLLGKIQLLLDHFFDLGVEVVHALDLVKPGDERREPANDFQVDGSDVLDIVVLHFHHHFCAVVELGAVRLSDGGGGQRLVRQSGQKSLPAACPSSLMMRSRTSENGRPGI